MTLSKGLEKTAGVFGATWRAAKAVGRTAVKAAKNPATTVSTVGLGGAGLLGGVGAPYLHDRSRMGGQ